jgi:hypothetical protein
MSANRGIPTRYAGVRFRSRLEATWAGFFDFLGWPWEYEPIDLDRYIPDFVLRLHKPLLVEVKPEFEIGGLRPHLGRIERSGWSGEALIVGAGLFMHPTWGASLGLLSERDAAGTSWSWEEALFHSCTRCRRFSFHHEVGTWSCRVGGCYDGDHYLGGVAYADAVALWRRAANASQWQRSWGVV